MSDIINSPIVLIMIFVISLFVGNRIYHMGLKRGIENGRLRFARKPSLTAPTDRDDLHSDRVALDEELV